MSWIQREWTPQQADEWTKEDVLAMIVSPLAYVALTLGVALSFLLLWWGFVILMAGVLLTIWLHWIIDPKLKTISEEYEKRQKAYLEELERSVRWEEGP
ncbi:MAG: hypothetical protein D6743_13720 [Calditrichaeota bacterium]|nr:MAG: hypothetical protein D6743_13720 [Calditrichota bacterium]